jgi:cell division protein FtsW (lipid II flippase)
MIGNTIPLALMCALVFLVLMVIAGAGIMQIAGFTMIPAGLVLLKMYQALGVFSLDYLQSANLWGQGKLGADTGTLIHTDYVLRYFMQEFGWLAGLAVVFAGCALLVILVLAMFEIKDRFGRMTVGGLTVCFAVQIGWHVLMSLGLTPVVSMNLPFISFGGTQTVIHLGAIGAILSIYKRKNLRSLSN